MQVARAPARPRGQSARCGATPLTSAPPVRRSRGQLSMQHVFVTGAAGFIGSSLVDRLLADGVAVTGWDNFSTGQEKFLEDAKKNSRFKLVRGDNLDSAGLTAAMQGCDFVFHLAANADIKDGWAHP